MIKNSSRVKKTSGITENYKIKAYKEKDLLFFYSKPIVVGEDKEGIRQLEYQVEEVASYVLDKIDEESHTINGKMTYLYGEKAGKTLPISVRVTIDRRINFRALELFVDGESNRRNYFNNIEFNSDGTIYLESFFNTPIDLKYFDGFDRIKNGSIIDFLKFGYDYNKTLSYDNILKGIAEHNEGVQIRANNYENSLKMQEKIKLVNNKLEQNTQRREEIKGLF